MVPDPFVFPGLYGYYNQSTKKEADAPFFYLSLFTTISAPNRDYLT